MRASASITTTSFEDTLTLARFMLCDRDADAFSRPLMEEEFQVYVRGHFWTTGKGPGVGIAKRCSAACGEMQGMQSRAGPRE